MKNSENIAATYVLSRADLQWKQFDQSFTDYLKYLEQHLMTSAGDSKHFEFLRKK